MGEDTDEEEIKILELIRWQEEFRDCWGSAKEMKGIDWSIGSTSCAHNVTEQDDVRVT